MNYSIYRFGLVYTGLNIARTGTKPIQMILVKKKPNRTKSNLKPTQIGPFINLVHFNQFFDFLHTPIWE